MNFELLKKLVLFQQIDENKFVKFSVGDTVKVSWLITEGKKDRIQTFEGVVISKKGTLNSRNFVIRKVSRNISIEKSFFINSPLLKDLKVIKKGKVRRSKLYYLRKLFGKNARIKEIKK